MKALVGEKAKGIKDSVLGKVQNVFGGGGGHKAGSTKVMNIVEVLDVGVPVRTACNHWTQYQEFSSFTKGVCAVSRSTTRPAATGSLRSVPRLAAGRHEFRNKFRTTRSYGPPKARREAPAAV